MTLLLFNTRQAHQAGQVFTAGHKKGLVLGQQLVLTTGNQGSDPPRNGNYPKRKFTVLFRDIFQFAIGQRRFFMNASGHDLYLPFGDIDDLVAGP